MSSVRGGNLFGVSSGLENMARMNWSQFAYGFEYTLGVEEEFDHIFIRKWMNNHWFLSVYIGLAYLTAIYVGQEWMRNRKPFELRKALVGWNLVLALFSTMGSVRLLPELVDMIWKQGLYASICDNSYTKDVRIQFWMWLFTCSKVIELGDTVFIILRKQKLIALHWIHHLLTLFSCFYVFPEMSASSRWFASMNYLVHSYMYTYYGLKAARIAIPRAVSLFITCSQIAQMVVGFCLNYLVHSMKMRDIPCDTSFHSARLGLSIYTLFFGLFINFFVNSYVTRKRKAC